ncbi:hypothetical protein EIP91_001310 [Steccherinum ochraceum]|uniref:Uncharacterized protein n=1 Tax=Steccherinum ochraceum TaxID=92696 RepID=A0A4R0RKM6_9APHY|nr:hypothetical protein EIP91_001310 [Steccherinum ochraceum]
MILSRTNFDDPWRYFIALVHYSTTSYDKALLIRHLSLGTNAQAYHREHFGVSGPMRHPKVFPFNNLLSFENERWLMQREFYDLLSSSAPQLESLSLNWHHKWGFPNPGAFEALKSLRVTLPSSEWDSVDSNFHRRLNRSNHVFSFTLTTLALHNYDSSKTRSFGEWDMFHFPNLRVLNLQDLCCKVFPIYQFIDLHSSLREVNVGFERKVHIRLESLIKLIEDTGLWVDPVKNLEQRKARGIVRGRDVYARERMRTPDPVEVLWAGTDAVPQQGDIPNSWITLSAFAYARAPLDSESRAFHNSASRTHTELEQEFRRPHFRALSLSLHIKDQEPYERQGFTVAYITDFFFKALNRFPYLEDLRIFSETVMNPDSNFSTIMVQMRNIRPFGEALEAAGSGGSSEDWATQVPGYLDSWSGKGSLGKTSLPSRSS